MSLSAQDCIAFLDSAPGPSPRARLRRGLEAFAAATARAAAAIAARRRHRLALRRLAALDDRLLADIGLNRGDILAAINGPRPR